MQVKISKATRMIIKYIKAGLVPMLVGSPGCGKSQVVHQIAANYNLKVIDLRLSQCDPCDLLGFPNTSNGRAGYLPMDFFPLEGDAIPDGYTGWLLFLDEFNAAATAVQAAAYKVVLDKMIGQRKLHKNLAIVCAGNLDTDNAITEAMSTALQSRLVHLELLVDHKEWDEWATSNGIYSRITSYLGFKPSNLYTFKPDHNDKTYACPRTWEFASRLLKTEDENDEDILELLAGTVSEGVAREFLAYCKIYQHLPTIPQIVSSPATIKVPEELDRLFAMAGCISEHATVGNIDALMLYIKRLPAEFQAVCVRETLRRHPTIKTTPAARDWIASSATAWF